MRAFLLLLLRSLPLACQQKSAPQGAREHKKKQKTLRERLVHFYKERNPENLDNIDAIMVKFDGREDALWENLLRKYPTRLYNVSEDDLMTDEERIIERERQRLRALREEQEMMKDSEARQVNRRWKTEVWDGADDLLSTVADSSTADAMEEANREHLLGRKASDDADLNPESIHGWVPYVPISEKAGGSRYCRNTCALTWKNMIKLRRSIGFLLFLFALPAIQVSLFCVAIGRDPHDLSIAVVNNDLGGNYSTQYLAELDHNVIKQVHIDDFEKGIRMVHRGDAFGVLEIPQGFTESWETRMTGGPKAVILRLDGTQQQISMILQQKATEAFMNVVESMVENPLKHLIETGPVDATDPVYGSTDPSFTDFVAPGIIVTIGFAQAIGLTAIAFVQDGKDGLLDRCWAAGVRPFELVSAHAATQFTILVVQIGTMLAVALCGFKLPLIGAWYYVIILMLLLGMTGMALGLLISAVAKSEVSAMQTAMGIFFPSMLLSGVIWPIQAIPTWLRYVSYALPTTWAAEAMRSVMLRGWDITHEAVWAGYAAVGGYTILMIFIASRLLRSVD